MDERIPDRFHALFREHYPSVFRKIAALVPDRAAAEDLAQEAFLRLYRNPPDDLHRIGPWLHVVSTRIAFDYLRNAGRREQLQEKVERRALTAARSYPSNEQIAIANWERQVVKRVLAKLSERDRQALLLKEEGYSHAEIAQALGVNPKIVGTLLVRAAERFRRQWSPEEEAES
ncbi:sigma-70 family RNA polymerase sigma factor [Cohnella sp. CFH 77786]|uniref:sigma-70 family RNA polymerase sigma factor n=1 Tax=Cohnella sp. CFH 77786 TaxID=2662265 RepID=UPI001C60DEEE|nr:sigma-70 family RNA polymerase sigma factor [Cohnella sp. CFH 77786]MBW5446448.1 sigma-70 family RNA polymerase sigma factor [Cohnella sp. CFH 77786]